MHPPLLRPVPAIMNDKLPHEIHVQVQPNYIDEQSEPDANRFVFSYTVTIQNTGTVAAKLLTRHWVITDANGKVQEVSGEGVVGHQPYLKPGQGFQYTSGAIIETPLGSMQGSYQMVADDGKHFDAPIPVFTLVRPNTLH